jgi:hypothetical protein
LEDALMMEPANHARNQETEVPMPRLSLRAAVQEAARSRIT